MTTDICHICLENKNKNEEIIKDCCSAFICNYCWNSLLNREINNCPICNKYILETSEDNNVYINIYEDNIAEDNIAEDNIAEDNIEIDTNEIDTNEIDTNEIDTNEIDNIETNNNETKKNLKRILMILKWLSLGYLDTNVYVFIFFYKSGEYWSTMQFLNRNIYYWPLCMLYGYLLVCIYEEYANKVCQTWYD